MPRERLEIYIDGKATGFKKATQEAGKSLTKLGDQLASIGSRMTSIGAKMSLAITAPLTLIGKKALDMAMDVVESENLFEVSMGNMADAARAWSKEFADSVGLNEYSVRRQVGVFNVMLTSMGLAEEKAYDMSKSLTQLAYDMASFYNLPVEEAFQKLQAGITGEIEPLKRLGIVVNETAVKTYAYTHGIAQQGEELTEQQKILARYRVIMEQTSKAQGDMARTLESPANQLRIFKEQVNLLLIDLGKQLIPVFQEVIKITKPLVEGFRNLSDEQKSLVTKLGLLATAAGPTLLILGQMVKVVGNLTKAYASLNAVLLGKGFANLLTWGPMIVELGTAFGLLGMQIDETRKATKDYGDILSKVDRDVKRLGGSMWFGKESASYMKDEITWLLNNIKNLSDYSPRTAEQVDILTEAFKNDELTARELIIGLEGIYRHTNKLWDISPRLASMIDRATGAMSKQEETVENLSTTLGISEEEAIKLADAMGILEGKAEDAEEAVDNLTKALFGLFNKNQATTEATWKYKEALEELTKKMQDKKAKAEDLQKALFEYQDATEDVIQKIWEEYNAEGTSIERKKELQKQIIAIGLKAVETKILSVEQFAEMAKQFGIEAEEIRKEVNETDNKLSALTKARIIKLTIEGVGSVIKAVGEVKNSLDSLPNRKTIELTWKMKQIGRMPTYSRGGLIGAQSGLYYTGAGAIPVLIHPPEVILNPKQALNLVWSLANNPKKASYTTTKPSITQNITINSPSPLTESEIRRQLDLLSRQMGMRMGLT